MNSCVRRYLFGEFSTRDVYQGTASDVLPLGRGAVFMVLSLELRKGL